MKYLLSLLQIFTEIASFFSDLFLLNIFLCNVLQNKPKIFMYWIWYFFTEYGIIVKAGDLLSAQM
jgi:hypothetical protein